MLILCIAGILWSRALLSFASVLIVVPYFFQRRFKSSPSFFTAVLCIILPVLISFFWSDDHGAWYSSLAVKIPLLFFCLGFSGISISAEWKRKIILLSLLLISAGCLQSLWEYSLDSAAYAEAYLRAKTLPTPAENDHIRFSWLVVIIIAFAIQQIKNEKQKLNQAVILLLVFFLVVYLHILAAKTGLVCLYTGTLAYLLYAGLQEKKWKPALSVTALLSVICFFCYLYSPTFRNRLQYVRYEYSLYSQGQLTSSYSDAARILSMKAGYSILKEHPLYGVGFGDLREEVNQWHSVNHSSSLPDERFLPANEWLVYGAGSGWAGFALFTIGLGMLLFVSFQKNPLMFAVAVISIIPFLVDDTLEGQYGGVILAFIVFFGQQIFRNPEPA